MTDQQQKEVQIKAIAEEYAEHKSPSANFIRAYDKRDNLYEAFKKEAESALDFLSKRYCIVEREKVMSWWNDVTNCYLNHNHATFDGMREMFADLFGASMFNQNEE